MGEAAEYESSQYDEDDDYGLGWDYTCTEDGHTLMAPTANAADRKEWGVENHRFFNPLRTTSSVVPRGFLSGFDGDTIRQPIVLHTTVKEKEPIVSKERIASLEEQARRLLEHAQEMRNKVERFGEDDYPDASVIVFNKRFTLPEGYLYQYSAIKTNNLWYTTGPKSPKGYTWDQLINWMGDGVEEIYYVTKMERVV
jgi:hypothetical protein